MASQRLTKDCAALMVIDAQQRLIDVVERRSDVLAGIKKTVRGFRALNVPIIATEQYPKALGSTEARVKEALGSEQTFHEKTTFSAMCDAGINKFVTELKRDQWVLVGIEAHVCILQTARDLLNAGHQVTVLNDCISSRSIYDYSTAIAELRDLGARISSVETVLFELVHDSKAPEFKQISELIKCG